MAGRPPAYIGYSTRNHPQPSNSMHIRDNQPRPARHCPLHGFISRYRVSLPPRESALAEDESCPQRLSQGCLRPPIDESHFGPTWMRLQCKQEKPVVRYPCCLTAEGSTPPEISELTKLELSANAAVGSARPLCVSLASNRSSTIITLRIGLRC